MWDHLDFQVSGCFITALLYGDESGLESEDIRILENFEKELYSENTPVSYNWEVISDHHTTDICEVTNKLSDVYTARYNFKVEAKNDDNLL